MKTEYQKLSAQFINSNFVKKIEQGRVKEAEDEGSRFIRSRMRQDSFAREILNPVEISADELDRDVDTDQPKKIIEKEPDSVASFVTFKGAGQKTIGLRTASGRANAAAKASAIPHPKTASGRANAAAAAYMQDPYVIHTASGRANSAAKGTGHGTHGNKSSGRGNAAATATAVGNHIIPITASGRANAAARASAHMYAPYHPAFLADFTNTLILDDGASSTVITDVGITITHVADDGHTTTLESQ